MLWSLLCYKLGIPENVSIGTDPPENALVFDSDILEEFMRISDDELNAAFCMLADGEAAAEEERERMLEEDYDW